MRKRAQMKSRPIQNEPKHYVKHTKSTVEEKPKFAINKNWWIAVALVGIFLVVLLHNTYFNASVDITVNHEEEGFQKYYLSGPDPYYNMRLVENTYNTGEYPYYSELDPLLNYPLGARGGRAPLFNMMSMGFSRLLTPFMDEIDAIGVSMQFIPALFGALLIFPVYFLGKSLFGRKSGIVAAFLIAIVPIHIGSGHGSAFTLFDHDSFNLLLYMFTFLFLVLALKEKDPTKSLLYAILGGIPIAALSMTWVEAQFIYTVIAAYAIIQMIFDIFTNKINTNVFRTTTVILATGYLVSLPVMMAQYGGFSPDLPFFLTAGVFAFGFIYYLFGKKNIPWTISLPLIFGVGAVGLTFLYFVKDLISSFPFLSPFEKVAGIIFGTGGIYSNKVSQTIAEANTYEISHTVVSFGPAIYWVGWAGLIFACYLYYKQKLRRDLLFVIFMFIINLWLTGTAGRFLNDMVPWMCILAGWAIIIAVNKLDYKQMVRNVKTAGGGFHGIRRGVKIMHLLGLLFIAFILILPSAFVTFDAAIPSTNRVYETDDGEPATLKEAMFGPSHVQAYGLGIYKEKYWGDAFSWLSQQDNGISNPEDRPAFISWWDYGFYEVALGGHPTVADNFQDGIPPAANFHTSISEEEAIVVWVTRLLEGDRNKYNKLSEDTKDVLGKYLSQEDVSSITLWIEDTGKASSYGAPIGEEYEKNISKEYTVGQQYGVNAVYHDIVDLLVYDNDSKLNDEEITQLYHDLQDSTGWTIRYYGVEGYDKQIFNIFGFLSDKSTLLVGAPEDDFIEMWYTGYEIDSNGKILRDGLEWSAKEIMNWGPEEKSKYYPASPKTVYKKEYFDTMFYKTYFGQYSESNGVLSPASFQVPCLNMRHFYPEYISDLAEYQYDSGQAAVVIAKYYEGALINGTASFEGQPVNVELVAQKNLSYTSDYTLPIDHDKITTNETGFFELIAGAGSYLQVRKNIGSVQIVLTNITFDGGNDTDYAPISDDDAMRRDGSNYQRELNITIEPSNFEGYFYKDIDGDEKFNETVDQPLSYPNIILKEVTQVNSDSSYTTGQEYNLVINETTGKYNISGLMPGFYEIGAYRGTDYIIHANQMALYPGDTTYNIKEPVNSSLEGTIYRNKDNDTSYDPSQDEEISGAIVDLSLSIKGSDGTQVREVDVANTTTDSDGHYSFSSLIPGSYNEYIIRVTKYTDTGEKLYEGEESLTLDENTTKIQNISLDFSPIEVSGVVTYDSNPVEAATVVFEEDGSVTEQNYAEMAYTESNSDGTYSIDIMPGHYNISVQAMSGDVLVYECTDGKLTVGEGTGSMTQNYEVEKKSATVTGKTTYEGRVIENVTVTFDRDQGGQTTAMSDENGNYVAQLSVGNWSVSADTDPINESDGDYVYTFREGIIDIADIKETPTLDILLTDRDLYTAPN